LRGRASGGVRWYIADPIASRQLAELRGERGVAGVPSTLKRWVSQEALEFEQQCRHRQHPVGRSGRLDDTDVKITGTWASLSRAVDKEGHTIEFLLPPSEERETKRPPCARRLRRVLISAR
jgi:transposase-like protein